MDIVIARIAHVSGAMMWVGGTVFLVAVGVPYARSLGPEQRVRAISELGRRFRPWGWASLGLLTFSGVYMMARLHLLSWDLLVNTGYGRLLLLKLVLVAAIVILTALHGFVLGPRTAAGEVSPSVVRAVARSSAVLTVVVPVIGVLLAH